MSLVIPPIANEDRLPHSQAVWRTEPSKAGAQVQICVEYEGDVIARTYAGSVPDWSRVVRWRFGWPPR